MDRPGNDPPSLAGKAAGAVRSHGSPDILYVTHRVPYPPDRGDRVRNTHVLRQLAARGRVWLVTLAHGPVPRDTLAELGRVCHRVEVVPVGPARWLGAGLGLLAGGSASVGASAPGGLARVVRRLAGEADFRAAVASSGAVAPALEPLAARGAAVVVDLVDVDSQKWLDYAAAGRGPARLAYRLEGRRLRALEADLPRWATAVTLVSRAEQAVYESFCRPGDVRAVPNGVDLDYFRPRPRGDAWGHEPACAFVGAMDYRPNIDAACWFARAVWPRVRERHPSATFWVVGRDPTPAVLRLARLPGVAVTGAVADVRPYLDRAAEPPAPTATATATCARTWRSTHWRSCTSACATSSPRSSCPKRSACAPSCRSTACWRWRRR